ncbi:unnamed protein product, partial [Ectocarpus sp. 12 AP-2014]
NGGGRGGDVGDEEEEERGLLFPRVWILTSDPGVDRAVREDMPHLSSFFVPDAFGGEDGEDDGGGRSMPSKVELAGGAGGSSCNGCVSDAGPSAAVGAAANSGAAVE